MMSWSERRRRRGGMTQTEFLRKMQSLGFQPLPLNPSCDHPAFMFTHRLTGDVVHTMAKGEAFATAAERFAVSITK